MSVGDGIGLIFAVGLGVVSWIFGYFLHTGNIKADETVFLFKPLRLLFGYINKTKFGFRGLLIQILSLTTTPLFCLYIIGAISIEWLRYSLEFLSVTLLIIIIVFAISKSRRK